MATSIRSDRCLSSQHSYRESCYASRTMALVYSACLSIMLPLLPLLRLHHAAIAGAPPVTGWRPRLPPPKHHLHPKNG